MKKSDFINAVAEKADLSKKDTGRLIDTILEVITETLKDGNSVNFIGFGSFSTVDRAERQTKIPLTKKVVTIPARKAVKFKVGKNLKDTIAKIKLK